MYLREEHHVYLYISCIASVPARNERNSGHAKEFFAFRPSKKWGESKKVVGRGWGGERRECLPANPWILKNPFAYERGS